MRSILEFFNKGVFWENLGSYYQSGVFVYGTTLLMAYASLAIMSLISIRRYMKKNASVDYNIIVESPLAPGILHRHITRA